MSKLILHVGMGKTATSAIQKVARNKLPVNSGVKYVPYGIDESSNAHNLLADNHPKFNLEIYNEIIQRLRRDKEEFFAQSNLISSEFLMFSSHEHRERLIRDLSSVWSDIIVVFTIRRYDHLLYSSYLQALKTGYGLLQNDNINTYIERMKPAFSLPLHLGYWSKVGQVCFLDFDKGSIVKRFFEFLGVEVENISMSDEVNSSLITEVIGLINQFDSLNSGDSINNNRQAFIKDLLKFSDKYRKYSVRDFKNAFLEDAKFQYEQDINLIKRLYNEV